MLYVFHVDVGRMLSFDMAVALSTVENLKDTIERVHGLPSKNIVLLVKSGEMLNQTTQVSYYSAGTDTNPIYMFVIPESEKNESKDEHKNEQKDEQKTDQKGEKKPDLDNDLMKQIERCHSLQPSLSSVEKRTQLARKFYEIARDDELVSERLVHEQHLQELGWKAVVANMRELIEEFRQRFVKFCAAFEQHLEQRAKHLEILHNFSDGLKTLNRIPILPSLMPLAEEDFHGFDCFLDADDVFSRSHSQQKSVLVAGGVPAQQMVSDGQPGGTETTESDDNATADDRSSTSPNKKLKMGTESIEDAMTVVDKQSTSSNSSRPFLNLLQWITSKENQRRLETMCEECVQGVRTFDHNVYLHLQDEAQHILKQAEQPEIREIKGFEERLTRLDQIVVKIRNTVGEQKELYTSFQQNQTRANHLRDSSILPDLCITHQEQLIVMIENYQKICNQRRVISKAKEELCANFRARLSRMGHVENSMSEFDNRLLFYLKCVRRAERHLQVMEQIHQAPSIYIKAVTEVVRRKIFSNEFRLWATKLSDDFETIHNEEISRRRQFNADFEGHFLNKLFPGMNDMPPAFANEIPLLFDAHLPNINQSDIDMLSSHLPDLAQSIKLPDMGHVINFFVSRSGPHQKLRMEELLRQQAVSALGNSGLAICAGEKPLLHQRLAELQKLACEGSETDTENEFENVAVATDEASQSTTPMFVTTATSTTIMETMTRSAATSLLIMQNAETLTDESESSARAEVERLRSILSAMYKVCCECMRLSRADLEHCRREFSTYREDLQSELQMLHEQWNLIRMQNEKREEELHQTQAMLNASTQQHDTDLATMRAKLSDADELQQQIEELKEKISAAEMEQQRVVAAAREELLHEHKSEIESLRCRYKLMTSMELSPSETSLEKLERPPSNLDQNTIERSEHEAIIAQLRANFESEKEKAIAAALEVERAVWQTKYNLNSESVMGNVNILKEMLEEKDRQVDQVRKQNLLLTKEIYQLKVRIDALTNEEGNSWLKDKIEYLSRDKNRLEEELAIERERCKRLEMETSYSALRVPSSSHKYLLLDSCNKGDVVFVVWSVRHNQYMIVQDSPILYFVHGDCLSAMNLRIPSAPSPSDSSLLENILLPVPYYAIGRVVDREYCQAKKDENRYRVTKGTRFYRVKLVPLYSNLLTGRRDKLDVSYCTSVATSFSQCDSSADTESSAVVPSGCKALVPVSSCKPASPAQRHSQFSPGISTIDESNISPRMTTSTKSQDKIDCSTADPKFGDRLSSAAASISMEDNDMPATSSAGERCRYTSFSIEEDSENLSTLTGSPTSMISMPSQPLLLQTVITEQPTASSKQNTIPIITTSPCIETAGDLSGCSSDLKNLSFATACSEDSDEYRSFEHKDDTDFVVSE